jgi:hypothetical protein
MKKFLFVCMFVTTCVVVAQESVLLRLNYEVGDVLLVSQNVSQNMGAQGGMDMKIEMDMTITGKEEGVFSTASKIKSVNMNMLQGGMVMSFDSSKEATDLDEVGKMMKQQFDPMMLATISSKISIEGEVLETNIIPPTPAMDQFTKQAKGIKFPKEKVAVGSFWSDVSSQQGMDVKTTYTVSKIESGKVYIDVTGTVSGLGEGAVKGDLIVDIEKGIQDATNIEMSLSANGIEMTINTKSKTIIM